MPAQNSAYIDASMSVYNTEYIVASTPEYNIGHLYPSIHA